ncbi:MAG: hypothetical protein LBF95_03310 [Treponema sp.]|jgi:hypothetical protein|nr:hypothetical protein [Treponema sp.]
MKKKLLLVCVVGLLAANVFADHPGGKLGVGVFGGGGSSTAAGGRGSLGLSLKLSGLPLFWGVTAYFGDPFLMNVSADYYLIDDDLVKDGSFNLDWFFGIGGFGRFYISSNDFAVDLGLRLPIGLSWHIINNVELFADVVPGLGISLQGNPLDWTWGGELGLRLWL